MHSPLLATTQELEKLPRYPSELLPLSLYLGDSTHAYNAALNYAMKISIHVNSSVELYPAFPGTITTLHVGVRDEGEEDLLGRFEEVCDFIGECQGAALATLTGEPGKRL